MWNWLESSPFANGRHAAFTSTVPAGSVMTELGSGAWLLCKAACHAAIRFM